FSERRRMLLLVDVIEQARILFQIHVAVGLLYLGNSLLLLGLEPHDAVIGGVVFFGRVFGCARYYQRRSRFIDENRVHFVDYGVVVAPLNHSGGLEFHIVAQIVEAEFVVGAVGDVGIVGF